MSNPSVKRLHVIYVDDDLTNLKVVEDMLTSFGSAVTTCRNPAEALELLQLRSFHVALIDIHMPQMSGIELLHQLRHRIGPNRATPALALTADGSRDEAQYRELGFDGFVAKPVRIKSLLGAILAVLSNKAAAETAGRKQSGAGGNGSPAG
jgi:CheY-like chemotaxis protein